MSTERLPEFRVRVRQSVEYETVVSAPSGAIAAQAFVRRIKAGMPGEAIVDTSIEWDVTGPLTEDENAIHDSGRST